MGQQFGGRRLVLLNWLVTVYQSKGTYLPILGYAA